MTGVQTCALPISSIDVIENDRFDRSVGFYEDLLRSVLRTNDDTRLCHYVLDTVIEDNLNVVFCFLHIASALVGGSQLDIVLACFIVGDYRVLLRAGGRRAAFEHPKP